MSMRFGDAIQTIKDRINIVDLVRRYVDLKPNGTRFVAPCPFHQETKPSFMVSPDRNFFYCFGCHASGDIFEFYCRINGVDFAEALRQLAEEAGVELNEGRDKGSRREELSHRQLLLRLHDVAGRHFVNMLAKDAGQECRRYIESRGIAAEIVQGFGLGWAIRDWSNLAGVLRKAGYDPDQACEAGLLGRSEQGRYYDRFRGRLIFPIRDLSGRIIAFGGRIIGGEDEAKYINSPDTPIYKKKDHLYGLYQARRAISDRGRAILTEGYMDVLTLHQFGYSNGLGVLGTALTSEQIQRLSGFTSNLILVFDGDTAGRKAAMRSAAMLLARGLSCTVVHLPEGEDIDSFLKSRGTGAFDALCASAPDGLRYCASVLSGQAPRDAAQWLKDFLRDVKMPELVGQYATKFAQLLGISEKVLREGLDTGLIENRNIPLKRINNMRDVQIMIYAVRYPDRLNDLRAIGADIALSSQRAREYWNLLEKYGAEETFYHLDTRQKDFWLAHRGPEAAPLNNAKFELQCLRRELEKFYMEAQRASLTSALAENVSNDFAADLEYLRAIQETGGTNHEQS